MNGGEKYYGKSLLEVTAWVSGQQELNPCEAAATGPADPLPDLADVIGLPGPKRALEVAAAGTRRRSHRVQTPEHRSELHLKLPNAVIN